MNWNDYSWDYLICNYSDRINEWFNPDKFDWYNNSVEIAKHCSEYFDIWWNPDKFDWKYAYLLPRYCNKYFNIWWNDILIFSSSALDTNCKTLTDGLIRYCSNYVDTWLPTILKRKSEYMALISFILSNDSAKVIMTKLMLENRR